MSDRLLDIFSYESYRTLLSEYYRRKKEVQPHFSYRAFSRRTGFKAPNHLKRVIDGERNLSDDASLRYAEAMSLDAEETTFFCTLVRWEQSTEKEEQETLQAKLRAMARYRSAKKLDEAFSSYHSHWYIPAIFELTEIREPGLAT